MIGRCRLCAEDETPLPRLTLSGERAFGEPFTLSRCGECGAWQVARPLSPEFIRSYFKDPERWRPARDPDGRPVDPAARSEARRKEYAGYAQSLAENIQRPGRALDVGAGAGLMLSLLPDSFQKIAVEPNPEAAALAAQKGLSVCGDWAEDLNFPMESLSCLIMNQSFDHLYDPAGFLAKAVHWLQPGGLLLMSGLINPEGLIPCLYGDRFRLWHPLYQIYPPPEAMAGVLGGHGFQVIRWWQPYWGTPYGGPANFLRAVPDVLRHVAGLGRGSVSPAWPGNTYSLLARKSLLLKPLKLPVRWRFNWLPCRPGAVSDTAFSNNYHCRFVPSSQCSQIGQKVSFLPDCGLAWRQTKSLRSVSLRPTFKL